MIQMKKQLLSAALVAAFSSALAINANAATKGKITFEGKVVEQTCQVGDNDQNQFVTLNPVAKNVFTTKGDVAMTTPFSIELKNCTTGTTGTHAKKVKAGFSSVANVDTTNDYTLKNKTGNDYATNVHIQLFNEDGTKAISPMKYTNVTSGANPVKVTHSLDDGADFKEIGSTPTPSLQYIAKYYSTNTGVTAGKVETSVDFELVYE